MGSEDATLIRSDEILEIQMKRERSKLDMNKFVEWICHFQGRKSDNNLLQRLINSKEISVLFVTKSRCDDDVSIFTKIVPNLEKHQRLQINKEWKFKLVKALKTFNKFGVHNDLAKKRNYFCQKQGEFLEKLQLKEIKLILQRVLIWEQTDDSLIGIKVKSLLNINYHIPLSSIKSTFLALNEIVKKGRDEKNDILSLFRLLLSKSRAEAPKLTENYILRKEEKTLLKELTDKNILLLTGLSHCGKSQIAKKIAFSFFHKGYNFKLFKSVDNARIFLNTNPIEPKIAIIDDPFGHIEPVKNYYEIIEKLLQLIDNTENDNKIIVTSRKEILLDSFETNNLNKCKIKKHEWFDLTITEATQLLELYYQFPESNKYSISVKQKIIEGITVDRTEVFQLGELVYLLNSGENLELKDFNDYKRIARSKVKSIASSLKSNKSEIIAKILATLAMCGDTIVPIPLHELAYVLSNKQEGFLSKEKSLFNVSTFRDIKVEFPTKNNSYVLSKEALKAIDYLEERRFIYYSDNENEVIFSHPNYFEVGRFLFINSGLNKQNEILRIYRRCLYSLLPDTAFHATQQIPIFYKEINKRHQDAIIDLSFSMLRSLFPKVEDFNLIFLLNKLEDLITTKRSEERISKLIRRTVFGSTDVQFIFWYKNQIPFVSNEGSFTNNLFSKIDNESLLQIEVSLKNGDLVSAYAVWDYLCSKKDDRNIDEKVIKTVLQYNEAFIRKEIVRHSLSVPIVSNITIKNIFEDEHPDIVSTAIKTCFDFWTEYREEDKSYLLDLILKSVYKKEVAIGIFHFITTFGSDTTSDLNKEWGSTIEETREIWNIWSLVFPVVLRNHNLTPRLNSPYFSSTMSDAAKYLNKEKYLNIADIWFERIDLQLKEGKFLSEFELCILDEVLRATGTEYALRKNIFEKILTYPNRGFLSLNFKYATSHWDKLSEGEKDIIFSIVNSGSKDTLWMKAIILCAESPNDEIVEKITDYTLLFEKTAKEVIAVLSEKLLQTCLRVFTGSYHPSELYITHSCNKKFWKEIIRFVLINENKIYFEICLHWFLKQAVKGDLESEYRDNVWSELCKKSKNIFSLTKELIYHISCVSLDYTKAKSLWSILFDTVRENKIENEIINTIVENIELLQRKRAVKYVLAPSIICP